MHTASAPSSSGSVPRQVGPPSAVVTSPDPDAAGRSVRPTALARPLITPRLVSAAEDGFPVTHAYVRTFWIPVLGPGAIADLCRLTAAAHGGRPLKLPLHLDALARRDLVRRDDAGTVTVADRIRPLAAAEARRLPPGIRRRHQAFLARRLRAGLPVDPR